MKNGRRRRRMKKGRKEIKRRKEREKAWERRRGHGGGLGSAGGDLDQARLGLVGSVSREREESVWE